MTRRAVVATGLLLLMAGAAHAQVPIQGTVTDPAAGKPARGVRVEFGPGLTAWTGDSGQFALSVPPGTYRPALSCPRRQAGPLTGAGREVTVGTPARLEFPLPGGAGCLPTLSTTPYGEFQGLLVNTPVGSWFRLCGDTTYQIGARFTAQAWLGLNRLAGQVAAAGDQPLVIEVRGALLGPGAFDGGAEYRLSVEQLKSARVVRAADACR